MTLRFLLPVLSAVLFSGAAAAQSQPVPTYPAQPGSYQPAPLPEDDLDISDDPSIVYSTPNTPGTAVSSPSYDTAPRYERAPQPRGLSTIPIFGPLFGQADQRAQPDQPMQQNGMQQGGTDSLRPPAGVGGAPTTLASLPPEDQPEAEKKELPEHLKRQFVDYPTKEPVGTIVIDTPNTYLYLVLANGKAMRYGIGVGREGFTWSGAERISRMAEWPDWHPPAEMIERQPYLPRFMAGGEGNPLGARALYLGKTLYRIHGTNQPSTIGTFVSSGCIRLVNEDIADLYSRVTVGTRVVVLPSRPTAQNTQTTKQ
ncbi:MAG: L,D-transpeptidase [Pseudorhodoplanes sp.]